MPGVKHSGLKKVNPSKYFKMSNIKYCQHVREKGEKVTQGSQRVQPSNGSQRGMKGAKTVNLPLEQLQYTNCSKYTLSLWQKYSFSFMLSSSQCIVYCCNAYSVSTTGHPKNAKRAVFCVQLIKSSTAFQHFCL